MCGIVGYWRRDGTPADESLLRRMMKLIAHRGPDGPGVHIHEGVALGHLRLAIIDVAGSPQPMGIEEDRWVITFNGEIYNFEEVRANLEKRGHRFRTQGDTEVVLRAYAEWGERSVEHLRGMFAFAIYDRVRCELFLARDRVGKKPLYYCHVGNTVAYASEIKALLPLPGLSRDVDPQAVSDYLTLQYIQAPQTIFKQVQKLEPGATLTIRRDGTHSHRFYWQDWQYIPKLRESPTVLRECTRQLLDESVRLRLISEVPLGVFLSGGIDSTAVVAFMRRHITGDLKTFSIGFKEESYNELPYARAVARTFETNHTEFIVETNALRDLPRIAWHFDEPMGDMAALPTWYLSEMTRKHVTVALNGDGGDESFAGYTRHLGRTDRVGNILNVLRTIPVALRKALIKPLTELVRRALPNSARAEEIGYLGELLVADPACYYTQFLTIFRQYQKDALLTREFRHQVPIRNSMRFMEEFYHSPRAHTEIDRKLFADLNTYLPGALLPKVDRMTMAHGLEGRSPFLDHKLIEFAARLPAGERLGELELKHHLKAALRTIVPDEVLDRRKQGFSVPAETWFRGGQGMDGFLRDVLLSPKARARGFFRPQAVAQLIRRHHEGRQRHAHRLWVLLMFELWAQHYLDTAPASS